MKDVSDWLVTQGVLDATITNACRSFYVFQDSEYWVAFVEHLLGTHSYRMLVCGWALPRTLSATDDSMHHPRLDRTDLPR